MAFNAGLSVIIIPCAAQSKIYYFKNTGKEVQTPDSADYSRVVVRLDSAGKIFNVYEYYPDKTVKLIGTSSAPNYLNLQGTCTRFFSNGQQSSSAFYKDNRPVGEATLYYPNGKPYLITVFPPDLDIRGTFYNPLDYTIKANYDSLGKALITDGEGYCKAYDESFTYIAEEDAVKNGKRNGEWKASADSNKIKLTETYDEGKLLKGTALLKDGSTSSYTGSREISPDYKGGMQEFYNYLGHHIHYPANAFKNRIQGRVIVQFIVEKDGALTGVKALRFPDKDLADEAVRVIAKSPNWLPGTQYGRPVRVQYTVPVQYSLNR